MPTPPYAKVLASVNGAALTSGGLVVAASSTVALQGENIAGWVNQLWEIVEYPSGYTLPAGWSLAADGHTYASTSVVPPTFTLAAVTTWGKYLVRLTVNHGLLNGGPPPEGSPLVDGTTSFSVWSPNLQLRDLGFGETDQFDAVRQWIGELKQNLRLIDGIALLGGGPPQTGLAASVITTGQVICSASDPANAMKVVAAIPHTTLAVAGVAQGIALSSAAIGDPVLYAGAGTIVAGPALGLSTGDPGPCVASATATAVRQDFLDGSEYLVGRVDEQGHLRVLPARVDGQPTATVTRYGADPSGATDSYAAFVRAIDSLPSTGGEVSVPPATTQYTLSQPLRVKRDFVKIRGSHSGASRIVGDATAYIGPLLVVGPPVTPLALGANLLAGSPSTRSFSMSATSPVEYINLRDCHALELGGQDGITGLAAFAVEFPYKHGANVTSGQGTCTILASSGRHLVSVTNPYVACAVQVLYSGGATDHLRAILTTDGGGETTHTITANNVVPVGTKIDVALTYDGTTLRLFVNGSVVASTGATGLTYQHSVEDFVVGGQIDIWPERTFLHTQPTGLLGPFRFSKVARHTGTYTPSTSTFAVDTDTLLYVGWDNQQDDFFTVGTTGLTSPALPVWLMVRKLAFFGTLAGFQIDNTWLDAPDGAALVLHGTDGGIVQDLHVESARDGLLVLVTATKSTYARLDFSGGAHGRYGILNNAGVAEFTQPTFDAFRYGLVSSATTSVGALIATGSNLRVGAFFQGAGSSTPVDVSLKAPMTVTAPSAAGFVFSSCLAHTLDSPNIDSTGAVSIPLLFDCRPTGDSIVHAKNLVVGAHPSMTECMTFSGTFPKSFQIINHKIYGPGGGASTVPLTAAVNLPIIVEPENSIGRATVTMTDGTYTVSTDEYKSKTLAFSGPLTVPRDVVVPTWTSPVRHFFNDNDHAIYVRTALGKGIRIPPHDNALLACDGTDMRIAGAPSAVIHVAQFGARGLGDSDDHTAIKSALAALPNETILGVAANGGEIFFQTGFYVIKRPLLVSTTATTLAGPADQSATIFLANGLFFSDAPVCSPTIVIQPPGTVMPTTASSYGGLAMTFNGSTEQNYFCLDDQTGARVQFWSQISIRTAFTSQNNNFTSVVTSSGRLFHSLPVDNAFLIQTAPGDNLFATLTVGGVVHQLQSALGTVTVGSTHNCELSYDGTTIRLFLDGVLVDSTAASGLITQKPWENVIVGHTCQQFPEAAFISSFNGSIHFLAIDNVAVHTSGYTNPVAKPTWLSSTKFLLTFDGEQDGGIVAAQAIAIITDTASKTTWLPVCKQQQGAGIGGVALRNLNIVSPKGTAVRITGVNSPRIENVQVQGRQGIIVTGTCLFGTFDRPHALGNGELLPHVVNITSSTNASPIVVQATAHGFLTGDQVKIANHLVNTAANGAWTLTRVDADHFSLNGSTGNGVGAATGTVATTEIYDRIGFGNLNFSNDGTWNDSFATVFSFPFVVVNGSCTIQNGFIAGGRQVVGLYVGQFGSFGSSYVAGLAISDEDSQFSGTNPIAQVGLDSCEFATFVGVEIEQQWSPTPNVLIDGGRAISFFGGGWPSGSNATPPRRGFPTEKIKILSAPVEAIVIDKVQTPLNEDTIPWTTSTLGPVIVREKEERGRVSVAFSADADQVLTPYQYANHWIEMTQGALGAAVAPTNEFVLPSTGAAAVLPAFANWSSGVGDSDTTHAIRLRALPLALAIGSAMTTKTLAPGYEGVTQGNAAFQYVSDPLAAQVVSGTVSFQMRVQDGRADPGDVPRLIIRAVSRDGLTVRGTLLDHTGNQLGTTYRNTKFAATTALTPVTLLAGDRLVFEVGANIGIHMLDTLSFRYGDTGSDLPVDESTTTDLKPWISFSGTIAFEGRSVIVPAFAGFVRAWANLTDQAIDVRTPSGAAVVVPSGARRLLGCDGTDIVDILSGIAGVTLWDQASANFFGGSSLTALLPHDGSVRAVGWRKGVVNPNVSIEDQTGDTSTTALSVQGQFASATATGSNKVGGSLSLLSGGGTTADGTDDGAAEVGTYHGAKHTFSANSGSARQSDLSKVDKAQWSNIAGTVLVGDDIYTATTSATTADQTIATIPLADDGTPTTHLVLVEIFAEKGVGAGSPQGGHAFVTQLYVWDGAALVEQGTANGDVSGAHGQAFTPKLVVSSTNAVVKVTPWSATSTKWVVTVQRKRRT